ncbi:MAG: hypothetical protein WAK50_09920 [Nitrososphaeraceae archaeon]
MENEIESRYKVYQNSVVYGMIIDLRLSIDDYYNHLIRVKELILEIAKILSQEEWKFEKSTICTRIKEILEDKVREGKITERWIEECLPSEYKRSYTKSELSSQLKKDKKLVKKVRAKNKPEDEQGVESPREILVSTDGTQLSSLQGLECGNKTKDYERLNPENKELKEALVQRDRESFSTADLLSKREIEFMIPTEQFNEIHRVMENCNDFCYLTFDVKDKMFLCAESDTSRRRIKEIVTD